MMIFSHDFECRPVFLCHLYHVFKAFRYYNILSSYCSGMINNVLFFVKCTSFIPP